MKKDIPLALVIAFLGLTAASPAVGAAPNSDASHASAGSIVGRVKNAVSDQYLGNAKVSVVGTDIVAFTDPDGSYRIVGAPSGGQEIAVFYTGLDVQRIRIEVPSGASVERNVELTSLARYGQDAAVVKLDPYRVNADVELNAQTVATNEQRYAPNIKNVLATDSFGSIMAGSVGEFMKYIPGVTVGNQGNSNELVEFSIRGIGGALSTYTVDGAPMVFGSYNTASRMFGMHVSNLNSTARVEVTKVPTPSTPADSIGGSINMVSKSIFDNPKPVGHYSVGVNASSRNILHSWLKTPTSIGDTTSYKVLPTGSFDYSYPITKNFGIFLSALYAPKASLNTQTRQAYQSGVTATGTAASLSNPYMQSLTDLHGPRTFLKQNVKTKVDWRVTPHSVLSLGLGADQSRTVIGQLVRTANAGTNGIPTPAGGTPLSFGPDFTTGATGRGGHSLSDQFQRFGGTTSSQNLSYRLDDGTWNIEARLNHTKSFMEKNNPNGPFQILQSSIKVPIRVSYTGIGYGNDPVTVQTFDNSNNLVDLNNAANYKIDNASESYYLNQAEIRHGSFKVKRRVAWFSFPSSLEVGASESVKEYSNSGHDTTYTFNGPDGNPNTVDPIPASFQMQVYRSRPVTGGGNPPWLSPDRAWAEWKANPTLFSQTAAQIVATENNRLQLENSIKEVGSAAYVQAEARLFSGRLNVLTGVRFEKTVDEGRGVFFDPDAVFVRDARGAFTRDALGARIRKLAAGAVGSMEELQLTTKEKGASGKGSYDGYYPSLHLTYNVSENFLLRAAYASTFGRPDFNQIIPGTSIRQADLTSEQESDPSFPRGTLTVRNTGLQPWTADNYDLSFEYYTKSGGLFSAGAYIKDIKNFFGSITRFATAADLDELGLNQQYLGWNLSTRINAGDARVTGFELSARQSLISLGQWGKYIAVFANVTKLRLEGSKQADFGNFVPENANWGVSYGRQRIFAALKWNYRGLDRRVAVPAFGPDGFRYHKYPISMDVDLSYQLTPRLSLAGSVSNRTNVIWREYGPSTPEYARTAWHFDAGFHIGLALKGTF